jgi:hypothetical protein
MGKEVRKGLEWVQLFQQLKNYTLVCLKCGISRPTLRKWVRPIPRARNGGSQRKEQETADLAGNADYRKEALLLGGSAPKPPRFYAFPPG